MFAILLQGIATASASVSSGTDELNPCLQTVTADSSSCCNEHCASKLGCPGASVNLLAIPMHASMTSVYRHSAGRFDPVELQIRERCYIPLNPPPIL
jgi:hypothetical protein